MRTPLLRVRSLVRTGAAAPSQWEGRTAGGQFVYVRYRYGLLTVQVGADRNDALDHEPIFMWSAIDKLDGYMSTPDMLVRTGIAVEEGRR